MRRLYTSSKETVVKRSLVTALRIVATLFILGGITIFLPRLITSLYASTRSYSVQNAPPAPVAIVFGAGLQRNGTPSPVLQDRVATAAELYFQGKVKKLLMSGDNRFVDYNEPGAMRAFAIKLGVPEKDIVLDYAGRRTYDTCYRAEAIFGLEEAILVTQDYHLPRALFTCNLLGLKAAGVPADRRLYTRGPYFYWNLRELPATLTAFWEVLVTRPEPVLGNPEPIFPKSSS
jgi:SanA protein